MKKTVICKVCGYLSKSTELLEVCPACGATGKIFEEFKSPVSSKRNDILDLHIHPFMVHFPMAFVFSLPVLNFLIMFKLIGDQSFFSGMREAFIFFLPFASVIALFTGIYDGKLRFKKMNTPFLKIKLWLTGLFLVISFFLFVLQNFSTINSQLYNLLALTGSLVLVAIGAGLGLIGGKMIHSIKKG